MIVHRLYRDKRINYYYSITTHPWSDQCFLRDNTISYWNENTKCKKERLDSGSEEQSPRDHCSEQETNVFVSTSQNPLVRKYKMRELIDTLCNDITRLDS